MRIIINVQPPVIDWPWECGLCFWGEVCIWRWGYKSWLDSTIIITIVYSDMNTNEEDISRGWIPDLCHEWQQTGTANETNSGWKRKLVFIVEFFDLLIDPFDLLLNARSLIYHVNGLGAAKRSYPLRTRKLKYCPTPPLPHPSPPLPFRAYQKKLNFNHR